MGPVFFCDANAVAPEYHQSVVIAAEGAMRRSRLLALAALALLAAAGNVGADANLGRDIAANCASCHATDGKSRGGVPSLVGQDKLGLVQQMKDFRDGKRRSTIMQQLARGYTDAEIEAVAAYLSAQKAN